MRLYKGSRFRNVYSGLVKDSDEKVNRVFALCRTANLPPAGSVKYTVQAGDTFETLAAREYGDANKWYVLANANYSVFWPLELVSGTVIFIPPRTFAEIA